MCFSLESKTLSWRSCKETRGFFLMRSVYRRCLSIKEKETFVHSFRRSSFSKSRSFAGTVCFMIVDCIELCGECKRVWAFRRGGNSFLQEPNRKFTSPSLYSFGLIAYCRQMTNHNLIIMQSSRFWLHPIHRSILIDKRQLSFSARPGAHSARSGGSYWWTTGVQFKSCLCLMNKHFLFK